jgi:two-component system chemotaxis response regulator CheB
MADELSKITARKTKSTAFRVVAMAAPAGGLTALSTVLSELPKDFPAAIVVQHLDPHPRSLMIEGTDLASGAHQKAYGWRTA